ncbi:hypothetical protein LZ30DRAFT_741979 [Colletotrichum cereale]|nr:hypothetical protein LZ30DRAFT_741979 [Colletotrichum cereale]
MYSNNTHTTTVRALRSRFRRGQLHVASKRPAMSCPVALSPCAALRCTALHCFPACGLVPMHPTVGNAGESISSSVGRGKTAKVGDTATTAAGEANRAGQGKARRHSSCRSRMREAWATA